jgi:hypothetical protein
MQPVGLTPDAYDDLLGDYLPAEAALKLPHRESHQAAHDLERYEVSRDANNVRDNRPDLVDPPRPDRAHFAGSLDFEQTY